ncbi:uncharacterized protein LOC113469938 [Diaphorina citri]|uniref:Uncharacterized protein LOC113469938 n=1 Tax=Diaphorina citri TaxID=121845 RepID=A0A3Q0JAR7_DIACI|nr:uncharacterized protein LOC113469938 [Diaphorina citri]
MQICNCPLFSEIYCFKSRLPNTAFDFDFRSGSPDRNPFDTGIFRGGRYGGSDSETLSSCPVQNGIIMTKWGALKAGSLIAGIAAGMQPQVVNVRTLMQSRLGGVSSSVQRNNFQQSSYNTAFQNPINSRRNQGSQSVPAGRSSVPLENAYQPALSIPPNSIDNKWAATLAGKRCCCCSDVQQVNSAQQYR